MDIFSLESYLEKGQLDKVRDVLTALFASISYTTETDLLASIPYTTEINLFDYYFHSVIYLAFTLLGKLTPCEMLTYTGRIDGKVETKEYIYLFAFRRDDTAEEALAQIDNKDYALPFVAEGRKVFKMGVSFDTESRRLVGWKVAT